METITNNPELLSKIIRSTIIIVVSVFVFLGLKRVFSVLIKRTNLPTLMFTPFRLMLRYGVLIVGGALLLNVWDIPTQTLLAVVGTVLGLVAIGFVAVWSVLSNFLCTFVLILFKPFSVGDVLEIPADSITGKVVDLTLIFTVLRTAEDELIQIPNNMFFQKIFKRKKGRDAISLEHQLQQEHPAG